MRIFISAGEPSGDMHGANFIRAVKRLHPDVEFVGFGGEKMEAAGCRLLYPLCQLSVMWFLRVLANLHIFLNVLSMADRFFRHQRPDAVILIDYPGLHWWVARRAHFHGIPVHFFVPPQIWAWASWRVKNMQRWVDQVLCTLPFEEPWYRERHVPAQYIGHPYFDELTQQRLDTTFVREQQRQGGRIIGLLPGSRNQEVHNNFRTMIRTARRLHQQIPDARFLVACFKPKHLEAVQKALQGKNQGLPIEPYVGRTAEIIHLAEACVAVSGSVSLELLYHTKPTVIVYRVGAVALRVGNYLKNSKYITLVNLLADRELFPEYPSCRCEAQAVSEHLHGWLTDATARRELVRDLRQLRDQVAQPGACDRAARFLLEKLGLPVKESALAA